VLPAAEAERWIVSGHVGDVAWEILSGIDRAYPEGTLGVTWDIQHRHAWGRTLLTLAALAAAIGAVALTVLDLTDSGIERWLARHNWTNQMAGSLVVVLATYVIVDRVIDRRRSEHWRAIAEDPFFNYVRELAEFRTMAFELGYLTIVAEDLADALNDDQAELWADDRDALGRNVEDDFKARRADTLRLLPILGARRSALTIFFSAIPELTNLLPTQLRIDHYVSVISHAVADSASTHDYAIAGSQALESQHAFDKAFNLHLVGIRSVFGASELDDLFEAPRCRPEEAPGPWTSDSAPDF
jgi:hypothetical protein